MMKKLLIILLLSTTVVSTTVVGQTNLVPKPYLGQQVNWAHALSKSLIGCWLFNEGTGNQVFDLSGNNNTGTFAGDTHFVPGRFGSALNFDGTGDYVDCGNQNSLHLSQMSIAFWVLIKSNTRGIITKGTSRGLNTARDWDIYGNGTDLIFSIYNGTDPIGGVGEGFPSLNEWHHIVCLWDGTTNANGLRVYVDCILFDSSTASATNISNNWNVYLGGYGNYSFDNILDHVVIFNRALSAEEIALLYSEPFCMFKPMDWLLYGVVIAPTVGGQVIIVNIN